MAEPKTARGRERKRAIISAAAALMYECGVHDTGVDDVLAAAGAGKSQFYHYFSDKDDLVGAVLAHQLTIVLGELDDFRLDTWKGIRAWFDAIAQGQQRRKLKGCPVGSLAVELSASGPDIHRKVAEAFERWEHVLASGLGSLQQRGGLAPSAQPMALAQATLATIQGGYLLSTAHHDIEPLRHALSSAYRSLRSARPS